MRWYVVIADYRPENDKSPKYWFKTYGDKKYVREWFREHYSWLNVYDVREVQEKDAKWALRI